MSNAPRGSSSARVTSGRFRQCPRLHVEVRRDDQGGSIDTRDRAAFAASGPWVETPMPFSVASHDPTSAAARTSFTPSDSEGTSDVLVELEGHVGGPLADARGEDVRAMS